MAVAETIRGNNDRVVGYACTKCGWCRMTKNNKDAQREAETCCEPRICKCGAECKRYHTACYNCCYLARLEKFQSQPEYKWNGEFPIVVWDDDKFLFDEDELHDYMDGLEEGAEPEFEACDPVVPRCFEVHDFLQDDLYEDAEMEGDWKRFDKFVNGWIQKHFPKSYIGNGKRITLCVNKLFSRPMPGKEGV